MIRDGKYNWFTGLSHMCSDKKCRIRSNQDANKYLYSLDKDNLSGLTSCQNIQLYIITLVKHAYNEQLRNRNNNKECFNEKYINKIVEIWNGDGEKYIPKIWKATGKWYGKITDEGMAQIRRKLVSDGIPEKSFEDKRGWDDILQQKN